METFFRVYMAIVGLLAILAIIAIPFISSTFGA